MQRYSCTDLRQMKLGGWDSSQMIVKLNGRWAYFYPKDHDFPVNGREPISFDEDYKPPNHQSEKYDKFYSPKSHPAHELFMKKNLHSKAPFVYVTQVSRKKTRPTPTAWRGRLDTIPEYKNPKSRVALPILPTPQDKPISRWRSVAPSPAPIDIMFDEIDAPKTQIVTPRHRDTMSSLALNPQRIQTGKGKYRRNCASSMKLTVE